MDEQALIKIGVAVVPFVATVAATLWRQRQRNNFVTISELWIYPIKSCKGMKMQHVEVTPRGFEMDRAFMVVDANGKFVTQRSAPSMALIEVAIIVENGVSVLKVTAPGMETLTVPTVYPANADTLQQLAVTVWGDTCQAIEVIGPKGSEWFSKFLQIPGVHFVRMKDDWVRKTDAKYAPNGQSSFADGFPFLLASVSSLQYTNERLSQPITQARFRPNIIVEGAAPFAEDTWEKIRFHNVRSTTNPGVTTVDMGVVKPCARCTIPNIDPETAVPSPEREPSRSMISFRSGEAAGFTNEKWRRELFYGMNLDHEGQSGMTISAHSTVEVLAAGAPFMAKH